MTAVVPTESIVSKIFFLRGEKILLDQDLAYLYGVETGILNRAVKQTLKASRKILCFNFQQKNGSF